MFKGGDPSILDNYRPISKLCCLAKVLEALVNEQLRTFMDTYNILQSQQSDFRPTHSTITASSLVVNDIVNCLDSRQHCAALFVDLSKAFDTVDHNILLSKLSSIGLDKHSVRWFSNYLSGRKHSVVVDNMRSSSLSVSKGVPQGSISGPTLFTLYINNIFFPNEHCIIIIIIMQTIRSYIVSGTAPLRPPQVYNLLSIPFKVPCLTSNWS